MIEIMKESAGSILGIRYLNTGSPDCDHLLVPKLAEPSQQFEGMCALFYIDLDFRGFELSAAWKSTKLNYRFRGNLDKPVVVRAPAWEEWCVRVALARGGRCRDER